VTDAVVVFFHDFFARTRERLDAPAELATFFESFMTQADMIGEF
jgi:hypothetical protein